MTREEVVAKMRNGHEINTTYIGKKIITASIDGVLLDARFVERLIDSHKNIYCSYYSKPDLWDKKSTGNATYSWIEMVEGEK